METISPQAALRPAAQNGLGLRIASQERRERRVSLCETLDRVLNKGAVVAGHIVVSIADVDLLYIGLNLMVTSVETMRCWSGERPAGASPEAPGPAETPGPPGKG
jgi:hypothetical protein